MSRESVPVCNSHAQYMISSVQVEGSTSGQGGGNEPVVAIGKVAAIAATYLLIIGIGTKGEPAAVNGVG